MKDTVVIFTNTEERSLEGVFAALEKRNQKYIRINTDVFHKGGVISLRHGGEGFWASLAQDKECDIRRIKSAWFRRAIAPKSESENYSAQFIAEEFKTALWSLYTTADIHWLNPPIPTRYILEHNKLYQQELARQTGLKTPETLVTNDPEAALSFCEEQGGVVAMKVLRSHLVADGEATYGIYTQKVDSTLLQESAESLSHSPVMLQQYVPKRLELRITVVGESLFSCAIDSQASERTRHDWRRYDFKSVNHTSFSLPEDVREKIRKFMHRAGINFGAIDMVLTPEGEFVFLEVNPSGQFGWIEHLTGLPISDAIAEFLARPA